MGILVDAYFYSLDTGSPAEEFAVAFAALREAGLTAVDIQWLVRKGRLFHLSEVGPPLPAGRRFRPGDGVAFDEHSCFVLTAGGVAFALEVTAPAADAPAARVPVWDADRRELRLDAVVVKRFRVPAPNQELILGVFQEEAWPAHIFDPLPRAAGVEPKRRLHDTIVALNRHQTGPAVRFIGDGTGAGLRWEPAAG
jgi:hypothetical protein